MSNKPKKSQKPKSRKPLQRVKTRGYWLVGRHAVMAALANPRRRCHRLLCLPNRFDALTRDISRLKNPPPIKPQRVDEEELSQYLSEEDVHQGVALLVEPLPKTSIEDVIPFARKLLILDQVTDPRNVGSILRSAAAFACDGVVVQERHAAGEDAALAKTASGALEVVPLIRETNLSRIIKQLKAKGFWVIGLDAGGAYLNGDDFKGEKIALVLGAEGKGLRPLVRKSCDNVLGLFMPGNMESLNVSVAAAVGLYEVTRFT